MAEETGFIVQIGEWVLKNACLQNKAWQESGLPPIIMSVNLSVRQFYQPHFIEKVRSILVETGISPEYLEFEITESMMMDSNHALNIVRELKRIGGHISLDDFGTGYSPLKYLKKFPIDKIKIDQSFIRNSTLDINDTTIVKAIIAMAHQLKLEVIAEGIETKNHLIFLQQNLCNEGQGYLFSKPLPPEKFIQNFSRIEQITEQEGIPQEIRRQVYLDEALENAHQELIDTVRQQQGMIFKFVKQEDRYIHTLCDGELMYRMGFTPEQVIGRELNDFLPLDLALRKVQYFHRAWDGEDNVIYEGEINGICYIASLRPIRKGGQVAEVIGSCVDITEQKHAQEALRLSESKYRIITTENILDLIVTLKTDGTILYVSPSHEKVLGLSPDVYKGRIIYNFIHPDDILYVQEHYGSMIVSKTLCHIEFRYRRAINDWIYV